MTQAVTARRDGDTFQARMFWWYAARLLDPQSPIKRVGFESGPKSFDDIWIEYDRSVCPPDQNGRPLHKEHIQCKWHVSPDQYGFIHLTDPEFINANSHSFLQRAWNAQQKADAEGIGARFTMLTNWRIERSDPLREIVSSRSGALHVGKLFATKSDKSKVGAVRKAWREHLSIDEERLRPFASTLALNEATDSLDRVREYLDALFGCVGLRRIPANEVAFLYDSLIFEWMAQGRLDFDRQSFREACNQQGILSHGSGRPSAFGVKSFEHPFDHLHDRCLKVLDFVPDFDERHIRSNSYWSTRLYPSLKDFLISAASNSNPLRLALDAHITLAYAAGAVLNIKSGRRVEIEQRTLERRVWSAGDEEKNAAWPNWIFDVQAFESDTLDTVAIVSLTHDISSDVMSYIARASLPAKKIVIAKPSKGPSSTSVACGQHAFELAELLAARINAERNKGESQVHLFIAAPNAFTFFLGQRQPSLGKTMLYEYDFEGTHGGTYTASLSLPL